MSILNTVMASKCKNCVVLNHRFRAQLLIEKGRTKTNSKTTKIALYTMSWVMNISAAAGTAFTFANINGVTFVCGGLITRRNGTPFMEGKKTNKQ